MITLAMVALTLTIGLVSLAYGYIDPEQYINEPDTYNKILKYNALEGLLDYCFQHADSPNPIQNLKDKGLLPQDLIFQNCADVSKEFDTISHDTTILLVK